MAQRFCYSLQLVVIRLLEVFHEQDPPDRSVWSATFAGCHPGQ